MTSTVYAPPLIDTAREHLSALVEAYMQATGVPHYVVGKIVRNDHKWVVSFPKLNFRVGTYDEAVQVFSAIWPDGLPWPAGVPRQRPARISEATLEVITAHVGPIDNPPEISHQETSQNG